MASSEEDEEEEGVCRMSVEIHTRRRNQQEQEQEQLRMKKRKKQALRMTLASLPKAAVTKAAISLRSVKVNRDSSARLALFMLKVGALELFRRGVQHRWPPLWWFVQGIPLLRAPPLVWLQRWSPFRSLIQGTQVFSKPVVFLSIATALTNVMDQDKKEGDGNEFSPAAAAPPRAPSPRPATPVSPRRSDNTREDSQITALRRELEEQGVSIPDRISNDELQRFYEAAHGSTKRFVALVKKNLGWRQNFRFLSAVELEEWSHLVYWHHHDAQGRPLLIIRLGLASSVLVSGQRPRFAQAIVSQIEYGVTNLLTEQDPRITVVLDCAGAPSVGFPLHMTKSCCVLVQENYPTRLAALFIVNLPPFVRVVANAIVQIIKPATRDKIFVESEPCAKLLADHLGGMDYVPIYLGGNCKCSLCNEARAVLQEQTATATRGHHHHHHHHRHHRPQRPLSDEDDEYDECDDELSNFVGAAEDDDPSGELSSYQSCTRLLRLAIVGLLMLWIVVALMAGFYEPRLLELPT